MKIFPGIIVRQHHTDRKQLGLLSEQYAEWKKVRLQYCCNQVWLTNGGQIPWNAFPICENPITAKDQSRIHQFGKKVLPGLFLGYALYAGGMWKGDMMVADSEEMETMDASEIYAKRLNAKEVIFPKENGKFIFPVADGRIKISGGDQELRTSTLIRPRPIQGEGHVDFLGETEGSTTSTSRLASGCR